MASRSPSRSEGELLSSDSEAKANTLLSVRKDHHVDRHTRTLSSAPRSPAARSKRSRSRSPYRAPRGEKRSRDEEYPADSNRRDPRTFHVRYEDDRQGHQRHGSAANRASKRSRTQSRSRSRSPYRHTHAKSQSKDEDFSSRRKYGREAHRSKDKSGSKQTADDLSKLGHDNVRNTEKKNLVHKHTNERYAPLRKHNATPDKVSLNDEQSSATSITAAEATDPILDEAAIIEERRKRREAIKNKYRDQSTPLLVQALHLNAGSGQNTPGLDITPASPTPSTPATNGDLLPSDRSRTREGSPFTAPQSPRTNDGDSPAAVNVSISDSPANSDPGSPAEDEPSAADYDPTIDMQEERARHDRRLFKEDDQSLIQAEKQAAEQLKEDIGTAETEKAEFDMFAEENEDDMFAEANTQAKPEPKVAQALDATMMDNWDDSDGYYITILGELIEDRYSVTHNLGRGMFSSVVRATDSKTHESVAIKIVRNNESMRKAGAKEIDILKDLAVNDPDDKKHMIRLLRSFDHKGHLCMVFEHLSMNLREVLKKFGRDIGINIKAIRAYAQQLFLGLTLLRKCQYLHADLKPDNILVNEARNLIKICDLGSASPVTENATAPYLVSRFYRAPEVILGIDYDYGIDMWSIGCTLFELYTGKILFTGRNNNNMLRSIMDCRGKFPHKLLRRGSLTYQYFDDLLNFQAQETDKLTGRVMTRLIDIKAKPVKDLRSRLIPKGKRLDEQERKDVELFLDLLDKCLDLRPDKRLTPTEALKHPFIMRVKT